MSMGWAKITRLKFRLDRLQTIPEFAFVETCITVPARDMGDSRYQSVYAASSSR